MVQNFVADRDTDTAQSVGDILGALDLPAEAIIREAQAEPNKLRLREQTEQQRVAEFLELRCSLCGMRCFGVMID